MLHGLGAGPGADLSQRRISFLSIHYARRDLDQLVSAEGTIVEARLEDPAGGAPFVIRETASWDRLEYVFRSPPVRGVQAGRDYRVEVRLLEPGGRLLATYARNFRSDVDQEVLPERAPVVGPGYQPR